jgi:flagellar protein FlaG
MEIQNKPTLQHLVANHQGTHNIVGGEEVPASGTALPSAETKAAPKVPEFEPKDLDKAIEDLQAYVDGLGRDLSFRRDEAIGRNIITVRDTETEQIVRQIPGEEVLAISRQIKADIDELRAGLLMNSDA